MKNPSSINLATSDEVRKAGWQAETRDADGHLCRTHVPFTSDEDIVWLVRESLDHGDTITIWPVAGTAALARQSSEATVETECFTVVFGGSLRKLTGNPHHYQTQFGPVLSIGIGNAFDAEHPAPETHVRGED